MLSKSFPLISLLILASPTNSQAATFPQNPPALDLKETPIGSEAQRPSIVDPCSNVNIAQHLDTSTTITADETGIFSFSAINLDS